MSVVLSLPGIAGYSHIVDSISAIKYAKVNIIREDWFPLSFKTEGDFPRYGNDDERADESCSMVAQDLHEYD